MLSESSPNASTGTGIPKGSPPPAGEFPGTAECESHAPLSSSTRLNSPTPSAVSTATDSTESVDSASTDAAEYEASPALSTSAINSQAAGMLDFNDRLADGVSALYDALPEDLKPRKFPDNGMLARRICVIEAAVEHIVRLTSARDGCSRALPQSVFELYKGCRIKEQHAEALLRLKRVLGMPVKMTSATAYEAACVRIRELGEDRDCVQERGTGCVARPRGRVPRPRRAGDGGRDELRGPFLTTEEVWDALREQQVVRERARCAAKADLTGQENSTAARTDDLAPRPARTANPIRLIPRRIAPREEDIPQALPITPNPIRLIQGRRGPRGEEVRAPAPHAQDRVRGTISRPESPTAVRDFCPGEYEEAPLAIQEMPAHQAGCEPATQRGWTLPPFGSREICAQVERLAREIREFELCHGLGRTVSWVR
ncbi:hypothetical protein DFH09DRAFT_1081514 [Mycena vulgaris]|nr:hypothetical protein DFH09DRAFT_1081514 [Mycena vulgaris]